MWIEFLISNVDFHVSMLQGKMSAVHLSHGIKTKIMELALSSMENKCVKMSGWDVITVILQF